MYKGNWEWWYLPTRLCDITLQNSVSYTCSFPSTSTLFGWL